VIEPDAEVIEPDAEVIEPDAEVIELDAEVIEPDAEVIEPDAEVIEPDAEVPACSGAAECADDDPCTEDLCEGGVCRNPAIEGCCLVDGDCADEDLCTDDRCVDHACQNIAAESCCMADRDCGVGGVCTPGGRCAAHAVAGDVRFNEIMFNPVAVDDDAGEWLELYNATGADIDLNGWGLKDNRDALYPLVVEGGALILPAGGFIVLGKSTDAATNGGISVAYAYDAALQLGNSGDQLSLFDPFGEIIDAIAYGEGWQTRPGSSLSLDPSHLDAANRDDPTMWCASLAPPLASGDRGTPGAANPSCTPPVNAVDWCRYQWPVDQASPAGTAFDAYARIFEAGMTDLTARVDANPILDVEIGYGPQGSDPASAEGWIFTAAGPNWDWDDAEEPNNDEYMASITAPSTGVYDLAARVTVDDGQSWTYCDTQAASGDGSADGYQIDNAGRLTIEASACDPNPCDEVQRACRGNTAVIYAVPGACSLIEGGFECDYGQIAEEISCGLDTCEAGECVSAGVHPAPGEVIFTEVLYDPNGLALLEENAEWFEVHNLADAPRTLNGCTIGDLAAPTSLVVEGVTLEAGGYAVFAHSLDPALNGGIDAVGVYGFGLNSGGDALFLQCDGVEISAVNFEEDAGFPNARAASIQLDPSAYTAADFSDPALWCVATAAYFTPEDGVDVHYGTPGAANPPCPQPDVEVDACSLQWPLDTEIGAGEGLTVYGVVFEAGVTDRGPNSDTDPSLVAEVGYGPVGGDPAAAEWTWFAAGINPEWSDAARPGVDEYMGEFTAPAPGAYDFAYRFKRGEGEWRYCDRAPAEGTFGSDDGYSAAEAGHLTTFASPCEADPCAQAPAPACADANTVVEYVAPGACVAEGDQARCTFDEIHSDCAINGGRCEAGACVDALPYPLMGEVVINELLYDPHLPLEDGNAEWFELVNTSDHAVTLHGCTMVDSNEGNAQPITGVNMASGAYALFGQNADISLNGGLTFDHLYSFGLNNSGDSLSIRCGDALIDHVSFIGADEGQRVALQLDPGQLDADANDNADSWCYASEVYFAAEAPEGNHLGTPGAPNPACPEIVLVDACRLYAPDSLSGAPNNPLAVVGAIFEAGVTDQTPGADAHADLRFEFGYGADMSQPSARWTWMPAVAIPDWSGAAALPGWDGYEITFNAPAVGLYSYAFRASIDAGASWLYCDGGIG
ncbi:lamin tail domain-containing protein, partial [Myxococcota bacterium]|nr:lamin tail domain-containing protein [Myxococcota bacterium]